MSACQLERGEAGLEGLLPVKLPVVVPLLPGIGSPRNRARHLYICAAVRMLRESRGSQGRRLTSSHVVTVSTKHSGAHEHTELND